MKLYANPTSPFVRLVRIALIEMELSQRVTVEMVDAWADRPDFLAANPAGRVPALLTDAGVAIAESSMILQHLAALAPDKPLLPVPGCERTLARAGVAQAAFDAAVAIIISRKSNPDFDGHMVGQKRYRSMRAAFSRLAADLPPDMDAGLDLSAIATVVAWDYILFRFPEIDWLAENPALATWRARQGDRPSLMQTRPGG
jgi:glutathione S-transferase